MKMLHLYQRIWKWMAAVLHNLAVSARPRRTPPESSDTVEGQWYCTGTGDLRFAHFYRPGAADVYSSDGSFCSTVEDTTPTLLFEGQPVALLDVPEQVRAKWRFQLALDAGNPFSLLRLKNRLYSLVAQTRTELTIAKHRNQELCKMRDKLLESADRALNCVRAAAGTPEGVSIETCIESLVAAGRTRLAVEEQRANSACERANDLKAAFEIMARDRTRMTEEVCGLNLGLNLVISQLVDELRKKRPKIKRTRTANKA